MTSSGTPNFVSRAAAIKYYRSQGYDLAEVHRKLKAGEISIGQPNVPEGTKLGVNNQEGRYILIDNE